jgi:hypothetical protein
VTASPADRCGHGGAEGAQPETIFFGHIHAFRAFAIVNIVAIHAGATWLYFLQPGAPLRAELVLTSRVIEVRFHASTIYFALISGLLYSAVLHHRGTSRFFKG